MGEVGICVKIIFTQCTVPCRSLLKLIYYKLEQWRKIFWRKLQIGEAIAFGTCKIPTRIKASVGVFTLFKKENPILIGEGIWVEIHGNFGSYVVYMIVLLSKHVYFRHIMVLGSYYWWDKLNVSRSLLAYNSLPTPMGKACIQMFHSIHVNFIGLKISTFSVKYEPSKDTSMSFLEYNGFK